MRYNIVTYPDERLKLISSKVEKIDEELRELTNEMFKIMYTHDGIGLAAVQVGVLKRLFVIDIQRKGKFVMINPEIIESSRETSSYEEGCISLPGISAQVLRPKKIVIKYTNIDGKEKVLKASGLLATCIQHEYDHLNGKIFVDKIEPSDKVSMLKEYRKMHGL